MKYPKRSQYKHAKSQYRVRNWPEYELALPQTEGFLRCLAGLLEIDLPIPDHTTLSRRLRRLKEAQFQRLPTNRPIHLLIDSTGLRIHVGHMQKPPRNRGWRKLHLGVDAASGKIVASDLTTRRKHDCTQVPALLEQIDDPIASVLADGAYDTKAVYEAAHERGARVAHALRLQPAQHGREHHVQIQDDHRPKYAKSNLRRTAG